MTCELQFVSSSFLPLVPLCLLHLFVLNFIFLSEMLRFWLNETEQGTVSHHISLPFQKQFFSLSFNTLKFVHLSLIPFEVWFQVFVD